MVSLVLRYRFTKGKRRFYLPQIARIAQIFTFLYLKEIINQIIVDPQICVILITEIICVICAICGVTNQVISSNFKRFSLMIETNCGNISFKRSSTFSLSCSTKISPAFMCSLALLRMLSTETFLS
jgi:hypothetical protein